MQRRRRRACRPRRGVALVAALGLLALAGAMLAASFASSLAMGRATRSLAAAARADAEGRRGLAEVVAGWSDAADSLAEGGSLEPAMQPHAMARPVAVSRIRIQRLTDRLFVVTVEVRVGEEAATLASRRVRLFLERSLPGDGAVARDAPAPIAQWSVADLK